MMFLGIGIIRTEKCWPNSPTYSTDVGVLRGWGRAQITVDILGREAKKVEKHCTRRYDNLRQVTTRLRLQIAGNLRKVLPQVLGGRG